MSKTNLGNLQLDDYNTPAGRGDLGAEVALVKADLDALRATLNSLVMAYNATLAKLDADAGVTDANYAALNSGAAPAAITTV